MKNFSEERNFNIFYMKYVEMANDLPVIIRRLEEKGLLQEEWVKKDLAFIRLNCENTSLLIQTLLEKNEGVERDESKHS